MQLKGSSAIKSAFIISLIYFAIGLLWIFLSDSAVSTLADNIDEITTLQIYKGWFYIFVTTFLLFFLSYSFLNAMQLQYNKNIEQLTKYYETKKTLKETKEIVKASEIEISRYDILLNTIINNSPDAIYAKDLDGKYILFNKAAQRMVGIEAKKVLTYTDDAIFTPDYAKKIQETDSNIFANRKIYAKEQKAVTSSGIEKIFFDTKGPLIDKNNEIFGLFGISRDITSQKEYENNLLKSKEKFYNLSHLDTLTMLPNRLHISEVLTKKCLEDTPFCLIILDLDEFKIVNDSYGHRFGDKLLLEVSKILHEVFDSFTFISRMGGDEFGIILNSNNKEEINLLMQKLHKKLSNPFKIDLTDVYITASSGICIYPDDASTMEDMYQEADAAMYNAKGLGKNRFSFYHSKFKEDAIAHTRMITNLKHAIENNELELHFQSQNSVTTAQIIGAEILLRWEHDGKMVPPDIFIPIAERGGLIQEIGNFVLKEGFKTVYKWNELGILKGRIAINISARQLAHIEFISTLKILLKESKCEASWIELEITESSILENPKYITRVLKQLKLLGFYISMDDFGTGYSSLSYLKNLPIDKLKIDKSFITNIKNEPKNQIIVKTIIFLAKELNIHVLAEGVETQEELDFLVENKIDAIQGYYYSKPIPKKEMQELLKSI